MKIIKLIINILSDIVIALCIIFIVAYLIGIKTYVVLSGSMEPTLKTGSVCFINTKYEYSKLKKGDIIAFKLKDGVLVTHRINEVKEDRLVTKGDANRVKDKVLVNEKNYIGKNIYSIPKLGYIVRKLQTKTGLIICVTFIILIFLTGILLGEPSRKKETK